ncbi:MAG: hypothetical protein U9O89_04155 [Thermoproteota archaeon]|nr:hypothetical protein [Thermoproteota archaeon]
MNFLKRDATDVAGTAVLGALVVIFDYSMKYSGLKIPFPWLPYLKFDFTGVPLVLSWLLFELPSGIITSTIAFFAIFLRSGDLVGASMKALAELSTILGMALSFKCFKTSAKFAKASSLILGVSLRCIIMFFANLVVLPLYYTVPQLAVIMISPLILAFNVVQGLISILLGFFLYDVVVQRTSLKLAK